MGGGGGFIFVLLYFALIIGLVIYFIVLASRFVRAHQRAGEALESIAQTLNNQR
jgi:hypothetical protein